MSSPSRRESRAAKSALRKAKEDSDCVSPMNLFPSGFPSNMTREQDQKLVDFRKTLLRKGLLVENGYFDVDHELTRFLRARGWDLTKAELMFANTMAWRKDYGNDDLVEKFHFNEINEIVKIYPQFNFNCDKAGRPVYIERLGRLDVDSLFKVTTGDRMLMHHVREWEVMTEIKFKATSRAHGVYINQTFTILDLKGVNLSMAGSQVRTFIKKLTKVDQDNYPEHLGKMFVVNAPWAFKALWTMVKPLLDKRTQKKIDICSDMGTKKILQWVDADKLPDFLGGDAKEPPNGWGSEHVGPWADDMKRLEKELEERRALKAAGKPLPPWSFKVHGSDEEAEAEAEAAAEAAAKGAAGAAKEAAVEEVVAKVESLSVGNGDGHAVSNGNGNGHAAANGHGHANGNGHASPAKPASFSKAPLDLASALPPSNDRFVSPLKAPSARAAATVSDGDSYWDALDYFASPAYH